MTPRDFKLLRRRVLHQVRQLDVYAREQFELLKDPWVWAQLEDCGDLARGKFRCGGPWYSAHYTARGRYLHIPCLVVAWLWVTGHPFSKVNNVVAMASS